MDREPVRVAHFIGKLNAGGVEAVMNNYYRNIDRSRYQFDFFIDEDSSCSIPKDIEALGARYYVVPPCQKLWKYIPAVRKILRENNYSIVHSSLNTLSLFSLYAAWLEHVPVRINHNHNTSAPGETKRNVLKAVLKPFAGLFATDFCACSRLAGTWLFGKKAMARGRVRIFNNAVDLERFRYNPDVRSRVRSELGLEGKFVVGHVGRFCFQKNHEFLVNAFKAVADVRPDAVLLLVGIGDLTETVKAQVASLGLSGRVVFLGARSDCNRLYQAMDVFVLPSRYEGLPVVGVEAQAAGLPTIVSDGVTEEVKISDVIQVLPLSDGPSSWARAILESQSLVRTDVSFQVRDAGFDIKTEAHALADYYDSLLSR